MKKLRKSFIVALVVALLGSFFYYRSNKEMFRRGIDRLITDAKGHDPDAKGYDGSNPLTILSTQLITRHFNIHTNLDFERLDYFERFFEGFFDYYDRQFLEIKQPKRLEVYLFDGPKYYKPFARNLWGSGELPWGFYSPSMDIIVVNTDTGGYYSRKHRYRTWDSNARTGTSFHRLCFRVQAGPVDTGSNLDVFREVYRSSG